MLPVNSFSYLSEGHSTTSWLDHLIFICNIDGVSGTANITELWRQHYVNLFICVPSEPYCLGKLEDGVLFSPNKIYQNIVHLAYNRACGMTTSPLSTSS